MKRKNDNLLHQGSSDESNSNISRLMKLANDSKKPGRVFTESLIESALGKLEQLKTRTSQDKENITIKVNWWEKVMGLAAMFAVICLAGLSFLVSQIHSAFSVIVLVVMFINRIVYIGGLIL